MGRPDTVSYRKHNKNTIQSLNRYLYRRAVFFVSFLSLLIAHWQNTVTKPQIFFIADVKP